MTMSHSREVHQIGVVGAIVGTFLSLTLLTAPSNTADASASPLGGSWPTWLAHPSKPACGSGEKTLMPSTASADALGVVHVSYVDYPTLTTTLPPIGVTASSASPELLADLRSSGIARSALASAPSTPTAPALCMSASATTSNWSPIAGPPEASSSQAAANQAATDTPNTHYTSTNWAGYQVNGTWLGVSGQWTVQQAGAGDPTPNQDTTWIGIGGGFGDGVGSLIQTGTDMQTNEGYRDWFEIVGNGNAACGGNNGPSYNTCGGITFVNPNYLRPGDAIYAIVYWTSTTRACFTLTDSSRASGGLSGCVSPVGVPYDTNTIEWIDEAHTWYQNAQGQWYIYRYLTDFTQTNWVEADAFNPNNGDYVHFTNYNFAADVMNDPQYAPSTNCQNVATMAVPVNASNGTSATLWCGYY
jgi:hypothetical protein